MLNKNFNCIIAGSREFFDYDLLKNKMDFYLQELNNVVIISGTAKGADRLGEKYAKEKKYGLIKMPADWKKYGQSAGYIRNKEMANIADGVVLFWDGKSLGTGHMLDIARKKGLTIRIVYF